MEQFLMQSPRCKRVAGAIKQQDQGHFTTEHMERTEHAWMVFLFPVISVSSVVGLL
ncbi:MAG: hypothetical protein ACJA0B_000610 [Alcanivorax borkumensis]